MKNVRSVLFAPIALSIASAVAAQQPSTPSTKKPTDVTLSGCVQKSASPNLFTLVDENGIYRLTGLDVREFLGRRVEVVAGPPRKLKIVGGLKPTPNLAGQAGAVDPATTATAVHDSASVNGTGPEMELRVRSIKPIDGSCGPREP